MTLELLRGGRWDPGSGDSPGHVVSDGIPTSLGSTQSAALCSSTFAGRLCGASVGYAARSATVLMLDMSRSMPLRGYFYAAKKVALALDSLIRSAYPRDTLHIIGFSDLAREIKPAALAASFCE